VHEYAGARALQHFEQVRHWHTAFTGSFGPETEVGSSLEVYEELISVPDYRPRVVQKTSGDFGCNFRKTIVYPARPDNNPVAR
jgi:hypothetical protein